MRGDLLLHLRMALRPRGVIGLVVVVAALTAVGAVFLPWYEIRTHVAMLGGARSGQLAALAGWQAQPWVWLVAALGGVAVVLGAAATIDRPAPRSSDLLLAVAVAVALLTGASALLAPPTARFGADGELQRYRAVAGAVPDDVTIRVTVQPAAGIWVALAAAGLLLATAVATRDL